MMNNASVIVVDSEAAFRKAVSQQLKEITGVELVGEAENISAATQLIAKTRPQLVILEMPKRYENALVRAQQWREEYPGLKVFVTSAVKNPDMILSAMRAGVSEFLSKPLETKEFNAAIERLVHALESETVHGLSSGDVIAVFSKKGGLGVTTLAVNLAVAFAEAGRSTVIADLAFDLGDVASQLDLRPDFKMTDALDQHGKVESGRLQSSLIRHETGLYYLGEKESVGDIELVEPEQLRQILMYFKESFQNVVLDLPHIFDMHTYEALQVADKILLVATCDLSTIRATRYALRVFRSLGYDERKVKIVLNRVSRKDAINEQQFAETVQYPVSYTIPSDYKRVIEAVNAGQPLTAGKIKGDVAKSLVRLAEQFVSSNGAGPSRK
ncbi:MAG: hypothetical protein Kow0074_16940 [Candidatus Zixiibacteriota bacterium]